MKKTVYDTPKTKMSGKVPGHPGLYYRKGVIYIRYYKEGIIQRQSTDSDNITEAQRILDGKKVDVRREKFTDLGNVKKIKFADFAEDFVKNYRGRRGDLSENSRLIYKMLLKKLVESFGHLALDKISDKDIDKYIRLREQATVKGRGEKKLSHFTINRELGVLRLILNWAKTKKMIKFNPVAEELSGKNLPKEKPRQRYFTDEELNALLASANEPMRSFILVGVNTGMRLSEILGLRWDEVGKSIILPAERTKSKEPREIKLGKTVSELFAELKLNRGGTEFVFANPDTGRPYNISISHNWKRLLKRAGVKPGRFHDLRRTYITRAAGAGAKVKDIQEQVGHRDFTTTMKVYAQATKKGQQEVADLADFPVPDGELVELKVAK